MCVGIFDAVQAVLIRKQETSQSPRRHTQRSRMSLQCVRGSESEKCPFGCSAWYDPRHHTQRVGGYIELAHGLLRRMAGDIG